MNRLFIYSLIITTIVVTSLSCGLAVKRLSINHSAVKVKQERDAELEKLYSRSYNNLELDNPFIVLRMNSRLLVYPPFDDNPDFADSYELKFGDLLYRGDRLLNTDEFFHVRTIDNRSGWISYRAGISLNAVEDPNLLYFSDSYYPANYRAGGGVPDNSSIVILVKNFVPLLLEDYITEGWFYPRDYDLALELSKMAVKIATDQDTFFYSAAAYDWRVNEVVISYNLLTDSLVRLREFSRAIEIQEMLLRKYFWKRADNTQVGGLNSNIKLTAIYIEILKGETPGSVGYRQTVDSIIRSILGITELYGEFNLWDKAWHKTASERVLSMLNTSLPRDVFYEVCTKLSARSNISGFRDMILLYMGIEKYREGKTDEALNIFKDIKRRNSQMWPLKIKDWLSSQKIVPDAILNRID